jgi:hypothetical protein
MLDLKFVRENPDIVKEINTEYQVIRIKKMKGLFDED